MGYLFETTDGPVLVYVVEAEDSSKQRGPSRRIPSPSTWNIETLCGRCSRNLSGWIRSWTSGVDLDSLRGTWFAETLRHKPSDNVNDARSIAIENAT